MHTYIHIYVHTHIHIIYVALSNRVGTQREAERPSLRGGGGGGGGGSTLEG